MTEEKTIRERVLKKVFDEWVEKTKGECDDFYGVTRDMFKKTITLAEQLTRERSRQEFNRIFNYWSKSFFSSTYQTLLKERIKILDINLIKGIEEKIRADERKKIIEKIEKFKRVPTQSGHPRGYYISIPSKDWEKLKIVERGEVGRMNCGDFY